MHCCNRVHSMSGTHQNWAFPTVMLLEKRTSPAALHASMHCCLVGQVHGPYARRSIMVPMLEVARAKTTRVGKAFISRIVMG